MNIIIRNKLPYLSLTMLLTYIIVAAARWFHPATFSYEASIAILILAIVLLITHHSLQTRRED